MKEIESSPRHLVNGYGREQEKYFLSQKIEEFSSNIALATKSYRIGVRALSHKMRYHGLTKKTYRHKNRIEQER